MCTMSRILQRPLPARSGFKRFRSSIFMACFMGTPWILTWRGFTQLARIGVFSKYALLDPIRLWVGLDIDPFVLVPKTGSLGAVFGFDSDVVNHGISSSLLEEFKGEVQDFFLLPLEEKKKLWQQPDNHQGFGQLFVVSEEQRLDWSDVFYLTTLPSNIRKSDIFQKLPQKLRGSLEAYCIEMKRLAMTLLSQMAKALKMEAEEIRDMFTDGFQSMRMNYYPPCPEPDMIIGLTPHSDAGALTILLQLDDIDGLQIRKEGRWVPVKPLPNAFVINVGDIMEGTPEKFGRPIQIVSNGVYHSVEHRVMVNSVKERLSVATSNSSNINSELGPAPSLISPQNPAKFQRVPTEKYYKDFFARKLDGKSHLKFLKIDQDGGHTS
ncbi:Protein SRG1 [Vitis vinifera]|uniref:Protein SRG1 n=1 Tax=Vitis vinifera TaxID=29760 RepID=A0A438EI73_VITVI|nr:Protein SRG1 [Vitis vinifera]